MAGEELAPAACRASPTDPGQDVAAKRKADAEQARGEAIYRAAVETCRDGFWMVDEEGRIVSVNEAYVRLSGYTREELLGMAVGDVEDGEAGDLMRAHLAQAKAAGSDFFMTWHRARDGRRWPVEVISAYWPLAEGRFFVFLRDVSGRQRMVDALKESEARFRNTFELAAVGIGHIAPDGSWLRVNRKLCDILGYSEAEMQQTTARQLTHPDDVHDAVEQFHRLFSGKQATCSFEKRYRHKTGRVVWANVTTTLARDERGAAYFISVAEDITDRRNMEAELSSLRAKFEIMTKFDVAGHTVAALAHELNQPLSAISSYAEAAVKLLEAGNPKPEKLRHALEMSARQAQRAGRVVHDLLEFLSHREVQQEAVDLNDLVRKVVRQTKAEGHEGVRFKLNLAADVALVSANRLQVQKVLANLLENGIEAMTPAHGAAVITVATGPDGPGGTARVTVTDTGPGIGAADLPRLFDAFFSTKANGLGLGLAISRTIVENHGGRLWAESPEGAGASFHFTLPFAA